MRNVKCNEGDEFVEVECNVEYLSCKLITLHYKYNDEYYSLQIPLTEQNSHLKVGDKIWVAIGIKMPLEVPKKSLREIYAELRQHALDYKYTSGGVGASRKATAYAIRHTQKLWEGQYE